MATYYGYAERKEKPIDWTKITGDIIDRTAQIEEGREKERAELDKIVADNQDIISSIEMGESETANQFYQIAADDGRTMLYDNYNKMKRGEITPSQYKMIQQQMMSQWGQVDAASKTLNAKLSKSLARSQKQPPESSAIEMWKAERLAVKAKLKNQRLVWDSESGSLYMSETDDEGKIIDPTQVTAISSLNKSGSLFVDRLDVNKVVAASTAELAEIKKVYKQGKILTKEGKQAMGEKRYNELRDQLSDAILSNNMAIASTLVDNRQGYSITANPQPDKDGYYDQYEVLMTPNSDDVEEPNFTDDKRKFIDENGKERSVAEWQREQADKTVKSSIDAHVTDIETPTPIHRPQRVDPGDERKDNVNFGYLKAMNTLNSGSAEEFEAVARRRQRDMNLKATDESQLITSIKRTPTEFVITYKDRRPETIKRGDSTKNVIGELAGLLTPMGGSYEGYYQDYITKEGGVFNDPNTTESLMEAATAPLEKLDLGKTVFNEKTQETITDHIYENATSDAASTAGMIQEIVGIALPKIDGEPISFSVSGTDPYISRGPDFITIKIGGKTLKIVSDGNFDSDNSKSKLNKEVQDLINKITENINQGKDAVEGIGTTEFNPESYKDE